jgi:PAS domain S-box-containing protein
MNEFELQAEIERFGRLYVASSHVSHAVVRSRSREDLLNEVVRILVEAGRFAMALVSWHDPASNELVPVACFGDARGYADSISIFADERPEGQGPAGTAFRSGTPYVCNDFLNDPRTLFWRDAAASAGWRASAAFPILIGGAPRGLLSVYAFEANAFGPDQVELLRQVTLDVAFGLEHLDGVERQRQAEEALSASERRLKLAMDAAALGAFEWDLRTGKIIWDGQTERMFGFEPGSFDGTRESFVKHVHPDDLAIVNRNVDAARASGSVFSHEFRIVWPDGTEHWLFGRGGYLYNDSGQAYRMHGAVVDITEQKRVEAALRENEERLRQAVRVANIGIFDHDHIADTIYWSPRQRQIHGLSPDEPVTLPGYLERLHPDDRERIGAAIKRSHDPAGDGFFDAEPRIMLPDGSFRWTSIRSQTFFEGEGAARHPVRTVGAVRDTTGQKQAEEEQTKLATVVAMNRDFIGIATLDGSVLYLNFAAMNLVGLASAQAVRGKTVFDFFAHSDRQLARDVLYQTLLKSGFWSGESRLQYFTSGKLIDVEITAFQIRDDGGAPLYIAVVAHDITERKRAQAEKAKLEEQLFQAQKMESIGRLAGGVAHDFNNLLTVINGYCQLVLAELSADDPKRDAVGEIQKAGERAVGLTRQLLAFSRKQVLQPRILDLNCVVQDLQPMLERLVGEDVEVSVALEAENAMVFADPHQLEQVIMNLAVNARDAMPGGGTLLIETANVELDQRYARSHSEVRAGNYVRLAVGDTGIGMDDKTRQRIFEPFFTTKPTGQGTGLGLSTVQGIVAQSGGHIQVVSEPDCGTTFQILLPALAGVPDDGAAGAAKPDHAPAQGGGETVLLVEDMPEVRDYTAAVLKGYGYHVIQAGDAGEALLVCERERGRIHLVLTDIVMPKVSGRELASRLEELRPGIKVLLMSGYAENVNVLDGVLDERVQFIEKPFTPEELARKVRAVLGPCTPACIMVADDEAGVRRFLRNVLEQGGYQVIEATDGKHALEEARAGHMDLVITDLVMPGQEGIETIQALRKDAAGVGIAISGAFGGKFLDMASKLGAEAVLAKPVSADALLAKVAEVLKSRQ